MTRTIIVDTGPLVAFFDRDEIHHQWMREQTKRLEPGLMTCEVVMAEGGVSAPACARGARGAAQPHPAWVDYLAVSA